LLKIPTRAKHRNAKRVKLKWLKMGATRAAAQEDVGVAPKRPASLFLKIPTRAKHRNAKRVKLKWMKMGATGATATEDIGVFAQKGRAFSERVKFANLLTNVAAAAAAAAVVILAKTGSVVAKWSGRRHCYAHHGQDMPRLMEGRNPSGLICPLWNYGIMAKKADVVLAD